MVNKKKNMFFIDAKGLERGIEFEVVTDTIFDANLVNHFYEIENHKINYELALILGLGVVESLLIRGNFYLYNASNDHLDSSGIINEVLRLGVYYQITHPDYDDKELEALIIDNVAGKEYLKLLQTVDSDMPYNALKEIFNRKKGIVIQFKKNV